MGMNSNKFGGLEQFMVMLAEELNKHGFRLILIYNNYPNSGIYLDKLNELNVELIVINRLYPLRFLVNYMRVLYKFKPLVIHSHFDPFFSIIYAKLFGFKNRIVTNHMMIIDNQFNEIRDINKISRRAQLRQRVLNYCATKFLSVSDAANQQFMNLYPDVRLKSQVFYLGAHKNILSKNNARESLNFPKGHLYVACLAFSHKMKGVDILIEAIKILKIDVIIPKFKVCIIGLDKTLPYTIELEQLVVKYNLEDIIVWFGIRDNVSELLPAMDIYCQPSRTECMPFSILEAGMAGLPCIGSRVGGIPEAILHNETGILFNVGDSYGLAESIKTLLLNKLLRDKMGDKAREYTIKNFDMQEQVRKMAQIYLNLP